MRFAVASQNFRTVTPHAGKTRRFLLFDAGPGQAPEEAGRLDLPDGMAIHDVAGGAHPLYAVDVVIAGSAGPGFVARMREHGVVTVATAEADPRTAITAYLDGTIVAAPAHEGCGHH
ncbi:NifB/NifX family molybdenum-iron cluster-binding protein [Azospirillum sp. A39]|uniref:NifB/NifX family molybdenum-iron cluster-binding protein n=1 Tax=Azospirillum sp. A39 TaxID=3462279 RepID=UPI004045B196